MAVEKLGTDWKRNGMALLGGEQHGEGTAMRSGAKEWRCAESTGNAKAKHRSAMIRKGEAARRNG